MPPPGTCHLRVRSVPGPVGQSCSLIVAPKGDDLRLPSDLLGVNTLKYDSQREDGDLGCRGACVQFDPKGVVAIAAEGRRCPASLPWDSSNAGIAVAKQRALLSAIEARDRCTRQDLCASFPDFAVTGRRIRLEQLRLLAFIDTTYGSAPDQMDADYALSAPYRAALEKIRRFIPGSGRRSSSSGPCIA